MKNIIIAIIFIFAFIGCKENSTEPVSNNAEIKIYNSNRVTNVQAWFNDTTRTAVLECTFVKNSPYSLIVKAFENDKDSTSLLSGGTYIFSAPKKFEYKPKSYVGQIVFKVSEITSWGSDSVSIYPKEIELLAEAKINFN